LKNAGSRVNTEKFGIPNPPMGGGDSTRFPELGKVKNESHNGILLDGRFQRLFVGQRGSNHRRQGARGREPPPGIYSGKSEVIRPPNLSF